MGSVQTKSLIIHGRFDKDTFIEWIEHRALKLSLSGWVKQLPSNSIEVVASGDPILLDAMEVACSLGPSNAMVERIDVNDRAPTDAPPIFRVLRAKLK